jgi:hypothetical protein
MALPKAKEQKMAKKGSWVGMLAMGLVFGLVLIGCATDVASVKKPELNKHIMGTATHDYTILGTVTLEKRWFGVIGFSIEKASMDAYFYQKGGISYSDLLEEARKQYPEADAVIDINVDYAGSFYGIFYAQRKNVLTGLAVKYVAEPNNE